MIQLFVKQYWLTILFFIVFQCVMNILLFLDSGVQRVSFIYFNIVWLLFVCSFFIVCFVRDRKWLKQFPHYKSDYWHTIKYDYEQKLEQSELTLNEMRFSLLERQDELLAWVHEMKSPLTVMQLLHEKIQQQDVREQIEAEWLRLYLLLDQQLHATRLLTIEQDTLLQETVLRDVVIQEVKGLRSWCFEKDIALTLEDIEINVVTDAKWLSFIVRQLLTNAVKYSHQGGEIRIYTIVQHNQLVLRIEDDGIGIAPEDLPRVFRKSYTGTVGRETSAASGMGLYLAKQAAEAINVVLSIDSTQHKGTTAHITFPKENEYMETLRT